MFAPNKPKKKQQSLSKVLSSELFREIEKQDVTLRRTSPSNMNKTQKSQKSNKKVVERPTCADDLDNLKVKILEKLVAYEKENCQLREALLKADSENKKLRDLLVTK